MSRDAKTNPLSANVVEQMKQLRTLHRWSQEDLAARIAAAGASALNRSVIANIENGRRGAVTVDELHAIGAAFGVDPWSLTKAKSYEIRIVERAGP